MARTFHFFKLLALFLTRELSSMLEKRAVFLMNFSSIRASSAVLWFLHNRTLGIFVLVAWRRSTNGCAADGTVTIGIHKIEIEIGKTFTLLIITKRPQRCSVGFALPFLIPPAQHPIRTLHFDFDSAVMMNVGTFQVCA